MMARCIAKQIEDQEATVDTIANALRSELPPGKAFASLLQLLLLSVDTADTLKQYDIYIQGRNLRNVLFEQKNLKGISFRNCDLTNTVFERCNLQDAKFEGARLVETRFEKTSKESLNGTSFGDLEHFGYIYVDNALIEEPEVAGRWVRKATGSKENINLPCATAFQAKSLFRKFVNYDGTGRRDELKEDALCKGKRYKGAPSQKECVEACKRFGYLVEGRRAGRLRRISGDGYTDIVGFVRH